MDEDFELFEDDDDYSGDDDNDDDYSGDDDEDDDDDDDDFLDDGVGRFGGKRSVGHFPMHDLNILFYS